MVNNKFRLAAAVFAVVFLSLHIYLKHAHQPKSSGSTPKIVAGGTFQATALDGTPVDLAAVAKTHRLTVLHFWESWCGPCKIELPEFQKTYLALKDKGVAFLSVYGSSEKAAIRELQQKFGLTFPIIPDHKNAIAQKYGIEAIPTTYVLDPELKVLHSKVGIDLELRAFLEKRVKSS